MSEPETVTTTTPTSVMTTTTHSQVQSWKVSVPSSVTLFWVAVVVGFGARVGWGFLGSVERLVVLVLGGAR